MSDALPIADVTMPGDLTGTGNGRLSESLLVSHEFPGHRTPGRAHRLGLRSFQALGAGCRDATGITLTVTSIADSYRTFEQQLAAFRQRYMQVPEQTFRNAPKSKRKFNGAFFVLRNPKDPALATPGFSNHGWGLAFDLAVFHGNRVSALRSSDAWPWVRNNAERFGFSWELQSEPWHVRLVTGDTVPGAVLQHEGHSVQEPAPIVDTPPIATTTLIVDAPPAQPVQLVVGVDDPHRVRWLQAILNERGWGNLPISGTFDEVTAAAVKTMQRGLGVGDDGQYGPKTAAALSMFLAAAA